MTVTVDRFDEIASKTRQQLLGSLPQQVARLHLDAASLAEYRSARLTEMLRFAAAHSRWHARRLSGRDLDAVTPNDLTPLPPMTKADVMGA